MKKLIPFFFLLVANYAFSQHCSSYFLLGKKTIQFDTYNKRNDKTGFVVYKISNASSKGNGGTSQVNMQVFDKNKKLLSTYSNAVKCGGDVLLMDMKFFIPQQQAEQYGSSDVISKNTFLEYPSTMQQGEKLKDGSFAMEVDKNGLKQILQMDITNRTVTGMETITNAAGKWNCYVIKYDLKLTLQTGPIAIPITIENTEWFAPLAGIVKTFSGTATTEISTIK